MRSFGKLDHPVEHVLGLYFHHCALAMTCTQLAHAGLFLATAGRNPLTGHTVVSRQRARRINALMLTCGHYDGSGAFAYRVGLPGKSGVEIGRASCGERVCQYVSISLGAVSLKK